VTGRANIERFLATDPRDVGCEEAMEILHVYAELAVSGRNPEGLYPGVAAHLRACGPCAEDLQGLLSALEADL
jgi:hypothetical protein